jgi:type III secretion protein J
MTRWTLWLLFFGAVFFASCSSKSTIVNSVPEREANEIVVILNSKGILAEKVASPVSAVGGATTEKMWDIMVPASQITDSLSILNQAGLPRIRGTTLLDLFGAQGLVPSDTQDKIRYQEGLSEQLATTIRKMDGIIDANVQITFPQEGETTSRELTASVFVKHRGILDNPNSLAITKIKRLVSSALPGLTVENVSVISDRALFADISLQTPQQMEEEKSFVSIWSVIVERESASRFRLIFYIFIIIIFLLACFLAWLLWKFFPLIQREGGIPFLIKPEQYRGEMAVVKEETEETPE